MTAENTSHGQASADTTAPGQRDAPATPIRLLHLSDFHFSEQRGWDAAPVLHALVDDIARETTRGGSPDFVVITGDLANSGTEAEYQLVRTWPEQRLWSTLGGLLPRDRLLLVPCNHDVDRKVIDFIAEAGQAAALVRTNVGSGIAHDEYWDGVRRRIEAEAEAPGDTYQGLHGYMKVPATDHKHLAGSLARALEARTGHADTHPALADRLAALGVDAKLPPAVRGSAADAWLGDALPGLLATMNEVWRQPLVAHGKLKSAWVAAKVLSTYPENPLWVIVVRKSGLFTNGNKLIQWLAEEYEVPHEAFFVLDGGKTKKIAKRVKEAGVRIL